ncbi:hypothetical protein F3Y22_tig00110108pilonHSYRG00011 [Hibiscus syriacus]|uniref:Uncharacterized protein n=1 Tax=Hibiscus syriacus TaxID=106335 RepID=A0A6A3BKN9_HIBSY|nr:hypothetical protein F3Y22_tig00110108pilonHSYRG00011 [Hibiscus syriacus]
MEGKASPKREFKQSRNRKQKALMRSNNHMLLEAIARANNYSGGGVVSHVNEDGVLRVKVMVRKQDLKKMLGMINGGGVTENFNHYQSSPSSVSVEERLNLLRRKHLLRSNAFIRKSRHCWSPELQSIPEE